MLKYIIYSCFFIIVSLSMASCEKVIDVKLNTSPNQVVIEGNINDQPGVQTITMSESVPYTTSNQYPPITGAQVLVTDESSRSWVFTETKPGTYTSSALQGQIGQQYTMKVISKDITYTAVSTIPTLVNLDSLSIKVITFGSEDFKAVEVHFKDPADRVNQYRWVMKINGVQIRVVYADNDRLSNGNDVVNVLFYSDDENEKLKAGDEVEVEMQCIDKPVFNYWFTLSQQSQNGPGGGVTPGNPPSNIDNKALGYFSAHTSQKMKVTVK
ncbi:DUF4249 domain-containing protein [Pedobacter sp. MR2016-24]|uniref:DUF4249 domain-containing protein n=1 Tax=Pedobacter sp. MR2016-24 TaxID=2994466 RepID=UPI002246891C|nr:DUF4249 domain-containing protein [Pedobacter sp. MR2016-24]MCX2483507.1 DUF4249 domain-containing protein [Pedobacter sp. MR2016-24]